jgi:S-adenosylmethionine:tRNA ribosyltransferase-isomerase
MIGAPTPSFQLPADREADRIPEDRGLSRDEVRLLVTTPADDVDHRFSDLAHVLRSGDLLVVNESATLAASLPARAEWGEFLVHLSTQYGPHLWLAEARWSAARPGPLPFRPRDAVEVAGLPARWGAAFPGISRLGFLRVEGDLGTAMESHGRPIRYGYFHRNYPLETYQTIFARVPGSAEMPSAGRPFSTRLRAALEENGVRFAPVVLHTGVSSLEVDGDVAAQRLMYPEPFDVPPTTAEAVIQTRARGGRIIAVGTTVVRALESALEGGALRGMRGFTRRFVSPDRPVTTVDGLLTGFHTATSTHLELLAGFVGSDRLARSYGAALDRGYLWHEFGDSHLLLR